MTQVKHVLSLLGAGLMFAAMTMDSGQPLPMIVIGEGIPPNTVALDQYGRSVQIKMDTDYLVVPAKGTTITLSNPVSLR